MKNISKYICILNILLMVFLSFISCDEPTPTTLIVTNETDITITGVEVKGSNKGYWDIDYPYIDGHGTIAPGETGFLTFNYHTDDNYISGNNELIIMILYLDRKVSINHLEKSNKLSYNVAVKNGKTTTVRFYYRSTESPHYNPQDYNGLYIAVSGPK